MLMVKARRFHSSRSRSFCWVTFTSKQHYRKINHTVTMKRSTQKVVQATEVETIDLTEDFDVDPGNRSTPPEEGDDTIPRIYIPSDDEDEDDDDGDEYFRELTPGASLKADIKRLVLSTNTGPAPNDIVEAAVTESGYFIEPGTDAELIFEDQEEFLRVTRLFNDSKGEIQLEGIPAVRTHAYVFHNRLLKKCNELCVVIQARADNKNRLPDVNEYLVTRPLSSVICTRKIIFTNLPFPKLSVREAWRYRTWKDAMDRGVLVCRWKSIEFLDIVKWNVPRQTYVRLRKHECDIGVPDAQLMLEWRDAKTESSDASHQNKKSKKRKAINLIDEEKAAAIPDHRVHTYGDICAGAGGATTAAKRAGLQVNFALDNAADPCATLRMNFPGAKILHMEIFDFLKPEFAMKDYMRVDVLHISFPCQPYSTANTRKGKGVNDQKNKDLGLCVIELLKKIRPRIVTFEQSPNITKGENCPMFDALIHQLTAMDYSAQSQVVNLADYSNAQARKRLIIIASW